MLIALVAFVIIGCLFGFKTATAFVKLGVGLALLGTAFLFF